MKGCSLRAWLCAALVLADLIVPATLAAETPIAATRADRMLSAYFQDETDQLASRCLADIRTLDDWMAKRETYRQQLFEMLSLSPLPARTDLKAAVTGRFEHGPFTVEKLHFQSWPGLYVTANLYFPTKMTGRAPAILYLCGHGAVITNGISYGNKVTYQHHGIWFARHGYVCLIIDTLQLGEIQGLHHGTNREGMWWWNARGYTPAGVEAWNSIRALDYLCSRSEVDTNRLGVTGRSGGGAYSWWVAALDDRVKAAAPVAGITDLHNHVVDGAVEGHCDCMYTVNTYRWDYPQVAALVAPRPLLIVNTDDDWIFPLAGVQRTFAKVRPIYELHKARDKLGLSIGPGPHKDTQDLQVPVFRWFNQHLKGEDPAIEVAPQKLFSPQQLKVFDQLPADQINARIQETFVAQAPRAAVPKSAGEWKRFREENLAALREKVFAGWPSDGAPVRSERKFSARRDDWELAAYDFESQPHVPLRLYLLRDVRVRKPERVVLTVLGRSSSQPEKIPTWQDWLGAMRTRFAAELSEELGQTLSSANRSNLVSPEGIWPALQLQGERSLQAYIAPRGLGLNVWSGPERKQTHIRRRFMLLGQTLESMRVWDIRRAVQAISGLEGLRGMPLVLQGDGDLGCDALYAALFEAGVAELDLWGLPVSHGGGPDYLNVLRILDVPQAVAMVAERSPVRLHDTPENWSFLTETARQLGWPRTQVEFAPLRSIAGE